jgi:hypothetical protein
VCRDYQSRFAQVEARFPGVQFLWVDVEDDADLLHPLDVENFPTLLIAVGNEPRFLGPLTPQAETLERMIRIQLEDPSAPVIADPAMADLVRRIRVEKRV